MSKIKQQNYKRFTQANLMFRVDEMRFLVQHESYECKCRFDKNMFYSKQN